MAKGKYEYWLTPDGLLLLEAWARNGLTDEQIAHNMGITVKTLWVWKNKYGKLCNALKKGKEVVDIEVENALLKRALGYRYDEETKEVNEDTQCLETTKIVTKEIQPDVTAQIFWLKNRRPDLWRDKQNVELNASLKSETSKLDDLIKQMSADDG